MKPKGSSTASIHVLVCDMNYLTIGPYFLYTTLQQVKYMYITCVVLILFVLVLIPAIYTVNLRQSNTKRPEHQY